MKNDNWILENSVKVIIEAAVTLERAAASIRRDAQNLEDTQQNYQKLSKIE